MPVEYLLLRDAPPKFLRCPNCDAIFRPFLRGEVQSLWRKLFRRPYCAVICTQCKKIVGYEKP